MSAGGPDAVATLNPFAQVEAETIAFSSGLKTENCDDTGGGLNVTQISAGDYIKVKNVDFLDGVTSFEARVSSSGKDASIELHLDSQSGTLLGTCDVSGAASWTTTTCPVSGGSGTHDLFLVFTGSADELFKFNWWKFTGPTLPTDGDTDGAAGTGADGAIGPAPTTGTDGAGVDGGPRARVARTTALRAARPSLPRRRVREVRVARVALGRITLAAEAPSHFGSRRLAHCVSVGGAATRALQTPRVGSAEGIWRSAP